MFMKSANLLKWGILNVPFCSIFVPFYFYLTNIMTICIFMVLLISALAKIGAMKPSFLDSGSPRGEGGSLFMCTCGQGLLSLYSSYTKFKEKTRALFALSLTAICAELCCQTT